MYENQNDLDNQRAVMDRIIIALSSTPFVGSGFNHKELLTERDKHSHDFNVFLDDKCVGFVEVKCRTYDSSFFNRNGYMISKSKLSYLYRVNRDKKLPAMFAFRTSDEHIYGSMIQFLVENKHEWHMADPDKMSTTNHGKGKRIANDPGFVLPLNLFSRMA